MSELLQGGERVSDLTREQGLAWLDRFGTEIDAVAAEAGQDRRDYACTLLLAVVAPHAAAFYQIGDGAIAIGFSGVPSEYHLPFWPERGEFANTTFFATDPTAADHLQAEVIPEEIDEVALFTDGVEGLALRYRDAAVHDPFFLGLFPPLRHEGTERGEDPHLSGALDRFLGSARVNAETDDDKTLVLASRRVPAEAEAK